VLAAGTLAGVPALAVPTSVDASIPIDNQYRTSTLRTSLSSGYGQGGRFTGVVHSADGGDGNAFLGGSTDAQFWSWCVEPGDYLRTPDQYQVQALEHSTVGQIAARSNAISGLVGALLDFESGTFTTQALAQTGNSVLRAVNAFQLALWELSSETGPLGRISGAGAGDFSLTYLAGSDDANVIRVAESWIADALGGAFGPSSRVQLHVLETGGGQSQLAATVVPIPGAVWLFGSALLVLAGVNSRKRRRS
jgi:hypothetical protein